MLPLPPSGYEPGARLLSFARRRAVAWTTWQVLPLLPPGPKPGALLLSYTLSVLVAPEARLHLCARAPREARPLGEEFSPREPSGEDCAPARYYAARVPRPREFDLDAALDDAVRLFWTKGYAATSVRDLCDAMGLKPGSFYAAFESKEGCFLRALERYLATQGLAREPSREAVRAWFRAITDPERSPRGCLLVVSLGELPLLEEPARKAVRRAVDSLEGFFARCLAPSPAAAQDASLLAAAVLAIHVQARAGVPHTRLRALARHALATAGLDGS